MSRLLRLSRPSLASRERRLAVEDLCRRRQSLLAEGQHAPGPRRRLSSSGRHAEVDWCGVLAGSGSVCVRSHDAPRVHRPS